jgi:polar amino acid transport system permease protein
MGWDGRLFLTLVFSPLTAEAAWVTIWVATVAQAMGLAIGVAVAPALMAQARVAWAPAWVYLWVFRGTPLLAQILFFYAVLPQLGLRLDVVSTGLLALGVNEGARMAEVVRSGLQAVPGEQRDAAYALGLSPFKTFWLVVLPQAFRIFLPTLINNYAYMIKATSLLSVISFSEVLRVSQQLAESTTRPLEAYSAAAIWYLAILTVVMFGHKYLERRLAVSDADRAPRGRPQLVVERTCAPVRGVSPGHSDTRPIVVEARGLSKRLGGALVLDSIDISVRRGEVVVVIGRSGSGKSTLLRCLNRLESADAGWVALEGEPFGEKRLADGSTRPLPERTTRWQRVRMGMVFQSFHLFPHLTVLENVTAAPRKVLRKLPREAEESGRKLLGSLGLADKADAFPSELSGGQKQRVAIARAMAMEPAILLFDEPTSSLDPEAVTELLGSLQVLANEGATMIIVSHEIGFARAVADRVIVMEDGRIVEEGAPDEVLGSPRDPRTRSFLETITPR